MQLIILAAGLGTRLRPLTENAPKCMVAVQNKSLIEWQIETALNTGITDILIIGGYKHEMLEKLGFPIIVNHQFLETNMAYSLYCALEQFHSEKIIISYGDIVYSKTILEMLCNSDEPIALPIDLDWLAYWKMRFENPLDDAESLSFDSDLYVTDIGRKVNTLNEINGQYIGMSLFQKNGLAILKSTFDFLLDNPSACSLKKVHMTDLLQIIIHNSHKIKAMPLQGGWLEIDSLTDLELAQNIFHSRIKSNQSSHLYNLQE